MMPIVVPARPRPVGDRRMFDRLPGGGFVFALVDDGVRIEVRHLRRERHELHGEVDVQCIWPGAQTFEGSLSCSDLNLSSQTARKGRAAYCAERAKSKPIEFDWIGILDEACRLIIRAERTGDDTIVLDDAADDGPPRDFLVHGLSIPADSHSQLVCDGGGLKSWLLLLVLGEMAKRGIPVCFLDWEWNAARHKARKQRLFGADRLDHLHYKRCRNPITVEQDAIRKFCDEKAVEFIAIDSIGAAVDGKLADDDIARAYNRALDHLPPSLAAAHIPKNQGESDHIKAFGSAFFTNFARMTWTVKKQIGANENLVTVLLNPSKQNDGDPLPATALEFSFDHQRVQVTGVNPVAVEGLAEALPLRVRVAHLLKGGPMTISAISEELDAKVDTVTKAIDRGKNTFVKLTNTPDGIHRIGLLERRAS